MPNRSLLLFLNLDLWKNRSLKYNNKTKRGNNANNLIQIKRLEANEKCFENLRIFQREKNYLLLFFVSVLFIPSHKPMQVSIKNQETNPYPI